MTNSVPKLAFAICCSIDILAGQTIEVNQQQPKATFKAAVHEVLLPVVVLDSQGRAVGNLTRDDFQILDNGKRQVISGFRIETASGQDQAGLHTRAETRDTETAQPSAGPDSSSVSGTVMSRRYIAILFDDLHANGGDLAAVRQAASRVLAKSLTRSDAAAILSTSGRINTGLTRDQTRLQAAIAGFRDLRNIPRPRNDCPDIDHYEAYMIVYQHDPEALEVVAQGGEHCPPPSPDKDANRGIARAAAEWELPIGEERTRATLDVIREVARQMGNLPGQHILVLVSPGFIALTSAAQQEKSRAIDVAAEFDVTVSTLDTLGLETDTEDETKVLDSLVLDEFVKHSRIARRDVMAQLAAGTGGSYFYDNNDFEEGLQKVITPAQCRYLIQFSPRATKQDGTFHKIKVKVTEKGVTVHARAGYFAGNTSTLDK